MDDLSALKAALDDKEKDKDVADVRLGAFDLGMFLEARLIHFL